MNYQSTNYLGDLNLDIDGVIGSSLESTGTSPNDLDLFSQSEFFDLDVFSNDHIVPSKPLTNNQYLFNQDQTVANTQLVQYTAIKQEPSNSISPRTEEQSQDIPETKFLIDVSNEDKRKRNTAASARFRIKKKLKEQEMEQRAKELHEKVANLEKKLKTLEMENKCLKNLILVKNEQKNSELLEDIKKKSIVDSTNGFQFTS